MAPLDSNETAYISNSSIPARRKTAPILSGYISREQLAVQLGKSVRTLARWNANKIGPPTLRLGRTILYDVKAVRSWLLTSNSR